MSRPAPAPAHSSEADQRVVINCVSWAGYEAQIALLGDAPVPRVSYLDGAMELTSPSRDHERLKTFIGRLIETYALVRDVDLSGYGSWTLRSAPRTAGIEPDECFIIGSDQSRDRPDLAIEVVWTSGGLDKLEIYRRLGVPEVWVWREGVLEVYALREDAYVRAEQSSQLPGIDLRLLASFLDYPTSIQAMKAYRKALGG